jgi:Ca2+-dependent lipid-binding protein
MFKASPPVVALVIAYSHVGLAHYQVKDVDYGSQRSSTKNDNLNPVWGETFTFTIPTIDNMVLTCKLRDDDTGSRHDKLGWCKIKLEELGLTTTPKAVDYH